MIAGSSTLSLWDELVERLRARGKYNSGDEEKPQVILWPDKEKQWEALAQRLRCTLPHFLTLGPYNPSQRTGPAIWLRCMIVRTLPEANWIEDVIPILYLPSVSRQDIRAVENCSRALLPLAELQYTGVIWSQRNSRDWTIVAFLQSEDGLGLDVAKDKATAEALRRSQLMLADIPLDVLKDKRIDEEFLDNLTCPDIDKNLLQWLNNPDDTKSRCDSESWETFCNISKKEYDFDPERDGELLAGEMLGTRAGKWKYAWQRFVEAPAIYPRIPDVLRRAKPPIPLGDFFSFPDAWPQVNEEEEDILRKSLSALNSLNPKQARERVLKLEDQHAKRRLWVWAKLDRSPLACSIEHLAKIARITEHPAAGNSPVDMAKYYTEEGWRADAEALDAIAHLDEEKSIRAVVRTLQVIYSDWLEDAAQRFQKSLNQQPPITPNSLTATEGLCIIFIDGLRFDVAKKLLGAMDYLNAKVSCSWAFTALPTVTATSKPAVSPISSALFGTEGNVDFTPSIRTTGKELNEEKFHQLLSQAGFQVLSPDEIGDPSGSAWTECGRFDRIGHDQQCKLSRRILEEFKDIISRIKNLIEAGWHEIRIITDHGWLLLPGNLPKVELPAFLTESRWGRCAVLKQSSTVAFPVMPWHWCPDVLIAYAPGIHTFFAGNEYAHGGLSLQECVVPYITVTCEKMKKVDISIKSVKWIRQCCKVEVEGGVGMKIDIRTKTNDAMSSVAKALKEIDHEGNASLIVENVDLEGTAVSIVVIDSSGSPVVKTQTTVGGV